MSHTGMADAVTRCLQESDCAESESQERPFADDLTSESYNDGTWHDLKSRPHVILSKIQEKSKACCVM